MQYLISLVVLVVVFSCYSPCIICFLFLPHSLSVLGSVFHINSFITVWRSSVGSSYLRETPKKLISVPASYFVNTNKLVLDFARKARRPEIANAVMKHKRRRLTRPDCKTHCETS